MQAVMVGYRKHIKIDNAFSRLLANGTDSDLIGRNKINYFNLNHYFRFGGFMDFYCKEALPVLRDTEDQPAIGWDVLKTALVEQPSNVILFEADGKLTGLISYGDLLRAKKAGLKYVPINRNYSSIGRNGFMEARELFRSRPAIKELPVVDNYGTLSGICSSFDDLLYIEYSDPWKKNRYLPDALRRFRKVFLVRPKEQDRRRVNVFNTWKEHLEKAGVQCVVLSVEEAVRRQSERGRILLVDEEFRLGFQCLVEVFGEGVFNWGNVQTFKQFEAELSEHAYDELILKFSQSGVKVYNMIFTDHQTTPGRRRLAAGFKKWMKRPDARAVGPYVTPDQAPAFYGELYTEEYSREVGRYTVRLEKSDIFTRLKDCDDRYFHVKDGERLTVGQPEQADSTVWFFGPCFIIGSYVEDRFTIESFLQGMINRDGRSVRVVNCGCFESKYQEMIHMTSTPMKPGDVVVMHLENREYEGAETIDLTDILDFNDVPNEWLLDIPLHCNHKVNELYAQDLYDRMISDGVLDKPASAVASEMLTRDLAINSLYLDLYFNDFHPVPGQRIGTVGMHGNPFTLGHRYLIETASRQVDRLFVLLIEDELGIFSYAERFAMAVDATKDLPNVTIVSGGAFQATRNVFREYFVKVDPADMEESATADALIYTEIIAPRLGISCRFFGDENHNPKMAFFNELMKKILPRYGIDAIEIPRASVGGHAISASVARKAADSGDTETLLNNVPATTLRFMGLDYNFSG